MLWGEQRFDLKVSSSMLFGAQLDLKTDGLYDH